MDNAGSDRYARQTLLPEFGTDGQEKLKNSSVLIVGAGGLGSVSAQYLSAAGVGKIIISDDDRLEKSNLNRQIIHDESCIGLNKAFSAQKRMKALNRTVNVVAVQQRLNSENLKAFMAQTELVIDATDNFTSRQALNREALRQGKPWIFGGVEGFDGMICFFSPPGPPCFECIIKPPDQSKQSSKGIIGPTPGIIGAIQAMAAIRFLLGLETGLENRLLRLSGSGMRFHSMNIAANPDCPACSRNFRSAGSILKETR